jgi:uncharacterized membrane protein YsdA (DUF1294 family)
MNFLPILIILILIILGLPVSYFMGYTPPLISAVYILLSFLTFLVYSKDKRAAIDGNWRVSESTLHALSLFCGWPGAIVAQVQLRHKTRKKNFRIVFWFTVIANSGALIWLHTNQGAQYLHLYTHKVEVFIVNEMDNSSTRDTLTRLLRFHRNVYTP